MEQQEIIRNRIWNEIDQTKMNCECLIHYTDKERKWNRIYNCILVFIPAIGSTLYTWQPMATLVCAILTLAAAAIKVIIPILSQPESELIKLDSLLTFYSNYLIDLEELWIKNEKDNPESFDENALSEFVKLKKIETEKLPNLNKLLRGLSRNKEEELKEYTKEYLNNVYNAEF